MTRPISMASRAICLLACTACSSLAEHGGHNANLPNAEAGPFRDLGLLELGTGRAAPYVLNDDDRFERHLSVIDADGDIGTLESWAYAAHVVFPEDTEPDPAAPPNEIIRHVSVDARSFARTFDVVLAPEAAWEMGVVDRPAALRHEGEVWLYYAAGGGIGLAKSADGRSFTRASDEPVLGPSPGGWEDGATPTSPSVLLHPDGTFHMYFEVPLGDGRAIGEARSTDGLVWERSDGPVLASAGAPSALAAVSAEGRTIEYLYHAASDADGEPVIGMAARHDGVGAFELASAPVFSGSRAPTEPCVLRYDGFTLLFVTQKAGSSDALDYPAVAAGVAPATVTLPPRDPP